MTARRDRALPSSLIMDITHSFCYRYLFKTLIFVGLALFYCEVVIYYVVLLQCTWPLLDTSTQDGGVYIRPNANPLKVMMVADTHLLGPVRGHWFDKLRREWQMHRTFITAMTLHQPEVVVFLGDLLDEGQWTDDLQFKRYTQRFYELFPRPEKTRYLVAVGNHDVGFHYKMNGHLLERFNRKFTEDDSGVELVTLEGSAFILINSMALHGDGCKFCAKAEEKLAKIEALFNCSLMVHKHRAVNHTCVTQISQLPHYTRPIILQHFPLYRKSDDACHEVDYVGKAEPFRERWDVLSKEMSSRLVGGLNPRAVFDGHSHHGCILKHDGGPTEWTLPSFNWRNKNNPSFILSVFTSNNFAVSTCQMPRETTIFVIYSAFAFLIASWLLVKRYRWNAAKYAGFVKLPQRS